MLIFLEQINTPKSQQNERSALCILALSNLKPDSSWNSIDRPMLGITEMMEWFEKYYSKKYAPNSRETVRRYSIHQFVQMGLVVENPDEPSRAINSPNWRYQLSDQGYNLLVNYKTSHWEREKDKYKKSMKNKLKVKHRNLPTIPVKIMNGEEIQLSAGGQNELIKKIIEEFCPRFTPGSKILYLGDAGKKFIVNEIDVLSKYNVRIDSHGKMPDVIILSEKRGWLVFIEAVTSHGPVDLKRKNELEDIFRISGLGLVFITAFKDKKDMIKYINHISWETDVWLADNPDHLIHFDGEKFLGPYDE